MDNPYAPQTPAWYEQHIRELRAEIAAGEALREELRGLAITAATAAKSAMSRLERAQFVLDAVGRWYHGGPSNHRTLELGRAWESFVDGGPS